MARTINFKAYAQLARFHRPIGTWLLMFPSWWGLALASSTFPPPFLLALFALGAVLMRSAGCVYNDIVDQDFDRQVKRTASRPLAAREIKLQEAVVFLVILLGLSAFILFSLPYPVILTGFVALGLVFLYPWMKRITYWPQLFLGLTFNIGALMGWFCLKPGLSNVPFLFYGGGILWTLGYDTIYAFQDREDDFLVGVKSSALAVSSSPKLFLSFVYAGSVILWRIGGNEAHLGRTYWFFLGVIALHFIWQVLSLTENCSQNCLRRFDSNKFIGLLLFLGIVFSHLID